MINKMLINCLIAYLVLLPVYMFLLAIYIKYDSKDEPKHISQNKRNHAKLSKVSLSTPLSPYEIYKDKSTNLYVPRKQGGGVKIEDWHNE